MVHEELDEIGWTFYCSFKITAPIGHPCCGEGERLAAAMNPNTSPSPNYSFGV